MQSSGCFAGEAMVSYCCYSYGSCEIYLITMVTYIQGQELHMYITMNTMSVNFYGH